ncbi:MAG: ATP-dependent helicase DeaD, partial [Planctomycetota bacterium]
EMNQTGDETNQAANELKLSQQMLFVEEATGSTPADESLASESSAEESSPNDEVESGETVLELENLETNDAELAETTQEPAETIGSRLPAFAGLGLSEKVLEALVKSGYEQPTPIQAAIIPEMLAGRDVLAQSQTGSGKTAAFALPILSKLDKTQKKPQVLVLAPTRELAIQVAKFFETYGSRVKGFGVATIYGGQGYDPQFRQLKQRPQVVVGTPGRVIDHLERKTIDLSELQWLVLDEADEMLNMGFLDDVKKVLEHTPDERRIALFSATMPGPIREIADQYLADPARITIKQKTMTAENIRQRAVVVKPHYKLEVLTRLLEIEETDGVIVFTKTREASVEVAERLVKAGLTAVALNGDMPQRTRERTLEQFKSGKLDILVATDVAARGLDVNRVSHVVNYDLPQDSSSYVHRVGRTGRAGRKGEAFILLAPSQRGKLKSIEKVTRQMIELVQPPTAGEISQARVRRFKEQVLKTISEQDLTKVETLLTELSTESGQSLATIAAAITQLLQGDRQLFGIRDTKAWAGDEQRERGEGRERGRDRFRDSAGDDEGRYPRRERRFRDGEERGERRERSFERGERGDRGDRGERGDRGDRGERGDRRKERSFQGGFRKGGPPEAGMERYRIEVGHNDGVRPGNIVGAVTNEAGLDGSDIGPITIHEAYSTIDLPVWVAEDICEVLHETWVSGKQLRIRPASAGDHSDDAGAGRPRRGGGRFEKPKFGKRRFQSGPGGFAKGKSKGFGFKAGKRKQKREE